MIKNIVFDMGQVLIHFNVDRYVVSFADNKDDQELLRREVFRSVEWVQLDRNSITEEQAVKQISSRLPERLHPNVRNLFERWHYDIPPVEGMYELAVELKEKGYPIYLLSNASLRHHEFEARIPVLKYFSGIYFSADHRKLKPEADIYYDFLETFGLQAEECVFIDDSPANIEASARCGFQGIVFNGDARELRKKLNILGVNVNE